MKEMAGATRNQIMYRPMEILKDFGRTLVSRSRRFTHSEGELSLDWNVVNHLVAAYEKESSWKPRF
jgi:hypothetical protein